MKLEKYFDAWKNEHEGFGSTLTEREMRGYMNSSSKNILNLFRKGLVIDMVFKIVLVVSIAILIYYISEQENWLIACFCIALVNFLGLLFQVIIIKKIPNDQSLDLGIVNQIRSYLQYYYKYYVASIFVGSLSNSSLFIIGFLYYLYFKYGELRSFETDDFIVTGIGVLLSYGLGAVSQLKLTKFHIGQLEKDLYDIEEENFLKSNVFSVLAKNKKIKKIIIALLIFGIMLFLLFYMLYYKS